MLPDALLLALRVALDGRGPGGAAGAVGALGLLLGRSRCFSAAGLLLATVARPNLLGRVLAPRPPAAAALGLGAVLCPALRAAPGADARRLALGVPPLKAAAPAPAAMVLRCARWELLAAADAAAAVVLVARCFVARRVPSAVLLLLLPTPAPAAAAPAPLLSSTSCCDASSANCCMSALAAALLRVRRAPVPVKRPVAVGLVQDESAWRLPTATAAAVVVLSRALRMQGSARHQEEQLLEVHEPHDSSGCRSGGRHAGSSTDSEAASPGPCHQVLLW